MGSDAHSCMGGDVGILVRILTTAATRCRPGGTMKRHTRLASRSYQASPAEWNDLVEATCAR